MRVFGTRLLMGLTHTLDKDIESSDRNNTTVCDCNINVLRGTTSASTKQTQTVRLNCHGWNRLATKSLWRSIYLA